MPWRAEQDLELRQRKKEQAQPKKKKKDSFKQGNLSNYFEKGKGVPTTESSLTKSEYTLNEVSSEEEKEQLRELSRVVKVKEVQKVRFHDYASNVQAILINPKWKPFDPETQTTDD